MPRNPGSCLAPWLLGALLTLTCCGGDSTDEPEAPDGSDGVPLTPSGELIQPSGISYLGAFRLPGGEDRPQSFAYGGNAMTFRPDGDPGGGDVYPGSLFLTGHDRLAYGELPDGDQVAEISIPAPGASRAVEALPTAAFLQGFHEVTGGLFAGLDEIPRVGLLYLSGPGGARLHLAWGQHLQEEEVPSHACLQPTLASPLPRGPWFIGDQSAYSVNGYLLEIPETWAEAHASGRTIGTGRYRDGGWSGMGPALFAYVPWTDASGTLAAPRSRLAATTLLLYESSTASDDVVSHALRDYQHADEWEGGAWLTTPSGKSAVVFAGTKGTGAKYWYGWTNPAGPELPCVETEFVGEFTVCRLADGGACPAEDLGGCSGHDDFRGWWSASFEAQLLFYDPANLAQVAAGTAASHQPQPYATLSLDPHLFLNPPEWEQPMLGRGVQRRFRIGDVTFDRTNSLLYVLELYADGAKPLVHVFRVG